MLSKLQLPSLRTIVQDAHKNGAVANRFRVTPEEADRIRRADATSGILRCAHFLASGRS